MSTSIIEEVYENTEVTSEDTCKKAFAKGFIRGTADGFMALGAVWFLGSVYAICSGKRIDVRFNKR